MSRLYDRLLAGGSKQHPIQDQHDPEGTIRSKLERLPSSPCIVGDNVADYIFSLKDGLVDLKDLPNIAPPFRQFWVEMKLPYNDAERPSAVGALLTSELASRVAGFDRLKMLLSFEAEPHWITSALLAHEYRKWDIHWPTTDLTLFLDENGQPIVATDRETGRQHGFLIDVPGAEFGTNEVAEALFKETQRNAAIHLLTVVAFMHCKNVTIVPRTPSTTDSRNFRKRRGRELTRYHVLEISPVRRLLEDEGEATSKGLKNALHICRGHFKDYREHGLFGKYRDVYWWDAHSRGSSSEGVVIKDYEVSSGENEALGRSYREANEELQIAVPESISLDPDIVGRGARVHAQLQNDLAERARRNDIRPRSPRAGEPPFDLAWENGEITYIVEVKSTTRDNEERQLRLGVGQLMRYRQMVEASGKMVRAILAVERRPDDESWTKLCKDVGITLIWPETFDEIHGKLDP